MTFLNPILLWSGLGAIAIPILIHILMRRRRRPMAWGAMKFLIEAYRKQRRRMNLEQLLLLGARCLLVALVALAIAKPVLTGGATIASRGPRTLFILLDNGIASGLHAGSQNDGSSTELARSKTLAKELLGELDSARGDRAALIMLGGPADATVLPASSDLAAVGRLIDSAAPVASAQDLSGGIDRVRDELSRAGADIGTPVVAVLSRWRTPEEDGASFPTLTTNTPVTLLASRPASEAVSNIGITAVQPLRNVLTGVAAGVPVSVSLRRIASSDAATTKVILELADPSQLGVTDPGQAANASTARGEVVVAWAAGQESATAVGVLDVPEQTGANPGARVLRARIDSDALRTDDVFMVPIQMRDRLRIALLSPPSEVGEKTVDSYTPGDWLSLSLSPEAGLSLRRRSSGELSVTWIDPARGLASSGLGEFDAVLVPRPDLIDPAAWRILREATVRGALVVVSPPPKIEAHVWADDMIGAMGLDWRIERSAKDLTLVSSEGLELGPASAAVTGLGSADDLLSAIRPELTELVRNVHVRRVLDVQPGAASPGTNRIPALLALSDGSPLIMVATPGSGATGEGDTPSDGSRAQSGTDTTPARAGASGALVLIGAAPDLSWTDLPTKPLMVPLMQELVRQGIGRAMGERTVVAGRAAMLPPGASELALLARGTDSGSNTGTDDADDTERGSITVDALGRPTSALRNSGLYAVRASSGGSMGLLAVNPDASGIAPPRNEEAVARRLAQVGAEVVWIDGASGSESSANTADSAQADSANNQLGGNDALRRVLKSGQEPHPISWPLLVAALAVALIEVVMARVFSHAGADGAPAMARADSKANSKDSTTTDNAGVRTA